MAADGALMLDVPVPDIVGRVLDDIAAKEGFRKPKFDVKSGSGARDGYTSALFRAKIQDEDPAGRQGELSLMVKTSMPVFGDLMPKMYAAEGRMYDIVLPAMQEVTGLTEPTPWPRCLLVELDVPPPQCVVLVDLRPDGYEMARCREALDVAHLRLALTSLARFHGAGLALRRLRPDAFRAMHAPLTNAFDTPELKDVFSPFVEGLLKSGFAESVKDRFNGDSRVTAMLLRLFSAFKEDIVSMMGHDEEDDEGYTIIHDDFHINNVLFQYDKVTGAVTHCKLIDFQTANYGCPALDVASMMLPCTERAARVPGVWEGLLRGYHDELQATLRRAGIQDPDAVYSWDLFQRHWRRMVPYGLGFAPMMYTALCGDDDKILEMRETMAHINEGEKAKDVTIVVTPYTLNRFGDLAEDVARWGMMPTLEEVEARLAARAARLRAGK